MNVSVVIPTRGDQDLSEIIASLSAFDEVLIWDNSKREDLGVYARYAMIEEARNDVILTQDDDCVLAPETLQTLMRWAIWGAADKEPTLVANMPLRFRHDFYSDHCLVGFGAIFHRDLPATAFGKFALPSGFELMRAAVEHDRGFTQARFHRTCDIVFTALTPRILVDGPYRDLPWASAPNRMWKQPEHVGERTRMLELARQVRDA